MSYVLRVLSVAATAAMYLVLVMGAWVTTSGSAEGCGRSWPLCKGQILPDFDPATLIELGHRAISGLALVLVVVVAVWAWRVLGHQRPVRWLASLAVFFLVLQALLGAAAVLWPQPKAVLAAHFGISLVSFASVLLLAVFIHRAARGGAELAAPVHPVLRNWVWFTLFYLYVVTYLGAYVRHTRASLACLGWPLCNGEWLPTLYGPVGANFLHRAGAALAALVVVRLVLMARRHAARRPDVVRASFGALFLIILQVASGALIALGWMNVPTQMLHSSILMALFGLVSYLALGIMPDVDSVPVIPPASGADL